MNLEYEKNWPALFQLAAYLHEDWRYEYDAWEEAVDDFARDDSDAWKVPGQIENLLEVTPIDDVNRLILQEGGLYYREGTNEQTADWLRRVAARISREPRVAAHLNQEPPATQDPSHRPDPLEMANVKHAKGVGSAGDSDERPLFPDRISNPDSDGDLVISQYRQNWPNLFQLAAYLHEDWFEEYDTWEEAVDDFARDYSQAWKVPGQIENLLEVTPIEEINLVLYRYGGLYYGRDTNEETADWIREVAARISREPRVAAHLNQEPPAAQDPEPSL